MHESVTKKNANGINSLLILRLQKSKNPAYSLKNSPDKKKYKGILKEVNGNDFTVSVSEKVKKEGAKRPVMEDVDHVFQMDKVKYTKYIISFK